MTKNRNPATLLNEIRNSVYRKKCQVQSCWLKKSYTLHEGQIKWSKLFFKKKWLMVKNIIPPVLYKMYLSLKHICRMYHIKQHHTVNSLLLFSKTPKCHKQWVMMTADTENVLPPAVSSKNNGPYLFFETLHIKNYFDKCRGFSCSVCEFSTLHMLLLWLWIYPL